MVEVVHYVHSGSNNLIFLNSLRVMTPCPRSIEQSIIFPTITYWSIRRWSQYPSTLRMRPCNCSNEGIAYKLLLTRKTSQKLYIRSLAPS